MTTTASPLSDEIKTELAALIAAYKAAAADGSVSLSEAMAIATRGVTGIVSIVHRLQTGADRATRRAMIITGIGEFYDQVIAPIDLKAVPNFIEGIVDRAGKEMLMIGAGSVVDMLLDLLDGPGKPSPTPGPGDGDQDAAKPHSNVIGSSPMLAALSSCERPL